MANALRRRVLVSFASFASFAVGALVACASTSTSTPATDAGADASVELPPLGGSRPLTYIRTPDAWDGKKPLPLILLIHGYGAGGLAQAAYFGISNLVDEKQVILIAPDGTFDSGGRRFWNAVDTCCDFGKKNPDDVKYLTGLVDEVMARYPVDKKRVYVIGHSNGGAMTMRLACDAPERFAAAFELAGPFWSDPESRCNPSSPLALRVVHGTEDEAVPYGGGTLDAGASPGAQRIATFFAKKNGCGDTPAVASPIDIEPNLAGLETKVSRYAGCKSGADVELWAIEKGGHLPAISATFRNAVWDFFSQHTR